MRPEAKKLFFIYVVIFTVLYSPIALIGIGYGGLSVFNLRQFQQYCLDGEPSCLYRIEFYIYLVCLIYVLYRCMKWAISKLMDFVLRQ